MRINGTREMERWFCRKRRETVKRWVFMVSKWVFGLPKSVRASLRWGVVGGRGSKFLGIPRS
jgi:hypothetical protein